MKHHALVIILCLNLGACASLTRGTHEGVEFNSEPAGATVVSDIQSDKQDLAINGYLGCSPTPCKIRFSRKSTPVLTVSKDGYESIKFQLISTNATSKSATPEGTIIAGIPPGSYAQAGKPKFLKSIPVGGLIVSDAILTLGASALLDYGTGAGRSLSPNPVTAFLAPKSETTSETNPETNPKPKS